MTRLATLATVLLTSLVPIAPAAKSRCGDISVCATAAGEPAFLLMAAVSPATTLESALEQDEEAREASLSLDRPTRRLIQRGLRNEGFDPGALDGLFGPRTRTAIRDWQVARQHDETGYLDRAQADALQESANVPPNVIPVSAMVEAAANTPDPSETRDRAGSPPISEANTGTVPATDRCDAWNTRPFFETATGEEVTACLIAGADAQARDGDSWTPLHWAARYGDSPAVVDVLLAAGADPEAHRQHGVIPLEDAVMNENSAVLKTMLELLLAPVPVVDITSWRDANDNTWLHYIVVYGDTTDIEVPLAAGADVRATNSDDVTPLHLAAGFNENPAVVEALLAAGADARAVASGAVAPTDSPNRRGHTALHLAARGNENPAVVEVLLAAGADVTATNSRGATALHLAAGFNANPRIVEALLAVGADTEARATDDTYRTQEGLTPLHYAARYNNPAVVEALLTAGTDVRATDEYQREPLHYAARNNPAVIAPLLAAGAAVMAKSESGRTALHDATTSEAVNALVVAGADVNATDTNQRTPLHDAAARRPEAAAAAEALLAAGADVGARATDSDSSGRRRYTPLHEAARTGNTVVIKLLLAAGAELHARNGTGATPLHWAATSAIETLLAAGASPFTRNQHGWTPLHYVGDNPYGGSGVRALVAAGADPNATDENGNTPLHFAVRHRRWLGPVVTLATDSIVALLETGANPNLRNAAGQTSWDLAQDNESLQERRSEAYWRLNDARFDTPRQDSRRSTTTGSSQQRTPPEEAATADARECEISGYPVSANVQTGGLNWCSSDVDFQVRTFALQAAGAWCAIADGTSPTAA